MSRVVAVTGVCTEVARAAAHEFARRGDRVAALSPRPEAAERVTAEIRGLGGSAFGHVLDAGNPDDVETTLDRIEDELGEVEVWVNGAVAPPPVALDDLEPGELRRVTDTCYLGQVHATMANIERMRDHDRGVVVHLAPRIPSHGVSGSVAASGAFAAVRGFHEALAAELREEGAHVRVRLVQVPEDAHPLTVARDVVAATSRQDRRTQLLRAGAVGTGAAVAAGTTYLLRHRAR
ncbi:SDR family NAD(P)-dependent oxidoreductase [Phycicoccus sp. CSK15P-2]|uniref:SDR family NAD(P)-dependent oxidoreductase n=1 Tax=Phycicoccus sp. CSK15P-2 TaxID=2807627 RepID=UPI0019518737|nr:SDR family NAD(P)-dependent oxidoreductase [Phycicoccus sp. CSK15P-2]MBM6402989.1 SDR family NAD(P)-dependent oxidoreductase [Phycicoccus sp. CSK15P-2]